MGYNRRGENRSDQRKTSRSIVENEQTQPKYTPSLEIEPLVTLVGGESAHHYVD